MGTGSIGNMNTFNSGQKLVNLNINDVVNRQYDFDNSKKFQTTQTGYSNGYSTGYTTGNSVRYLFSTSLLTNPFAFTNVKTASSFGKFIYSSMSLDPIPLNFKLRYWKSNNLIGKQFAGFEM